MAGAERGQVDGGGLKAAEVSATLVVLGGLPGVGKSTLARPLLMQWPAMYLRIDTIEQALRDGAGLPGGDGVGAAGYEVAYELARSNLSLGRSVLADCVNPLPITRAAWQYVARDASAHWLPVHVVCSDLAEHRQRVEQRVGDVPGLALPTWDAVCQHDYAPWPLGTGMTVDTARCSADEAAARILFALRDQIG